MSDTTKIKAASTDLTPVVAAPTDVARLTHRAPVPPHEQTADQDVDVVDWDRVAAAEDFKSLIRAKVRFVVPASAFFIVYYFALPLLVGYAPGLMNRKVVGVVNFAYVFALSQFFMAWTIAALYVRAATRFDRMEKDIIARLLRRGKPAPGGN
ncbi:MAG: DUF485 domain-containing protein [Verrucomicrobiae bacterium]|nr:DUF485 domain-containing protein [Verrucomicrobiae bacterium]